MLFSDDEPQGRPWTAPDGTKYIVCVDATFAPGLEFYRDGKQEFSLLHPVNGRAADELNDGEILSAYRRMRPEPEQQS